jgi:hypothetical protein
MNNGDGPCRPGVPQARGGRPLPDEGFPRATSASDLRPDRVDTTRVCRRARQ